MPARASSSAKPIRRYSGISQKTRDLPRNLRRFERQGCRTGEPAQVNVLSKNNVYYKGWVLLPGLFFLHESGQRSDIFAGQTKNPAA